MAAAGDMSPLFGSPKPQIEYGIILYKIDFNTNNIIYYTTAEGDPVTKDISDKSQQTHIRNMCDDEIVKTNSLSGGKAYVVKNDDEPVYFVYEGAPKILLDEIKTVTNEPISPSIYDTAGSDDNIGGSRRRRRRRRPSRKYKKSKRVLRKKSRSTRRR